MVPSSVLHPYRLVILLLTLFFFSSLRGAAISVGGPMLTIYLTPSEEEIFKRYNPDLQRRSLAERHTRQQEFDDFVMRLKAYSKSDKPSMNHFL